MKNKRHCWCTAKKINVLTTTEISYAVSEARTEILNIQKRGPISGEKLNKQNATIEAVFDVIRRRLNLRGRVKRK